MFEALFFSWSVASIFLLVYLAIFHNAPVDMASPSVTERRSEVDQTEIAPREAIQADVAKKNTERAA